MTQPLDGIRIADFTMALSGPLATMMLADLGAHVVKIENADRPDTAWVRAAANRNKLSIVVNLKSADGVDVARDIIAGSQAVVSSFRVGVMERFGLGATDLLPGRPDLVYASFSGFGETGPGADRRATDLLVQAESGMAMLGGEPITHVPLVDVTAGLGFAQGILAALLQRERTGFGGRVQGRLFDAGVLLQSVQLAEFSATGAIADVGEVRYPATGRFQARDAPIVIAAHRDWHWRLLCEVLGLDTLGDDARLATRAARLEHHNEIRPALDAAIAEWDRDDLLAALDAAGVMAARIHGYEELFADPQVAANGTLIDATTPDGVAVKLVRPPFTIGDSPTPFDRAAPAIGGDTREVLRDLGYGDDRVEALLASGAVSEAASSGTR